MRFDLLGYLLNSLDDAERRRVEAHLRVDPALRAQLEELRRLIEPIDAELDALQAIDGVDHPPPSDLVARTMALIPGAPSEPSQPSVWRNRPERELAGGPRRTLADAVILLASALAMVSLALPLTLQARHAAQREQCATNIADFGEALLTVSHHDPNGRLPIIPADGPESFAGIVWVRLAEGFLPEVDQKRWCPSAGRPAGSLPFEELVHFANAMPEGLFALRRDAGGSYSTYLGVREDGRRVSAPRWQGRSPTSSAACAPSTTRATTRCGWARCSRSPPTRGSPSSTTRAPTGRSTKAPGVASPAPIEYKDSDRIDETIPQNPFTTSEKEQKEALLRGPWLTTC